MGNRAGKGRSKDQLLRTVNFGKKGDPVISIIGQLKSLGVLTDDKFSQWIRDCIMSRYSREDGIKTAIYTATLKTIRSKMAELAREKDYFEAQLDNIGYVYHYDEDLLVKTEKDNSHC